MSDRRQFSVNRACKQAFQGRHVRDALLRLAAQDRRTWPRATTLTVVVVEQKRETSDAR